VGSTTGVATIIDRTGIREHRFWDPASEHVTRRDDVEAAAALREALDQAVGDALASTGNILASHLSAGRDSSAVSALAARRLEERQGRLHAYTAVPCSGYGGVPDRYLLDEGPDAARFAASFDAITHHKVASTDVKLGALLDKWNSSSALGHSNAVGLIWWSRIFAKASAEGADTLLSGGLGNFTISAGGPWAIPDVLHEGYVVAWQKKVRVDDDAPRDGEEPGPRRPALVELLRVLPGAQYGLLDHVLGPLEIPSVLAQHETQQGGPVSLVY